MTLPEIALPLTEVEVGGQAISVRSLTRAEARHVQIGFHAADLADLADVEAKAGDAETFILACGLGVTVAEAAAWSERTDSQSVDTVLDAILVLSGLKVGQPDPKPFTSEPS